MLLYLLLQWFAGVEEAGGVPMRCSFHHWCPLSIHGASLATSLHHAAHHLMLCHFPED